MAATRRLGDFPESGRPGRVSGTRELVIAGTPYIAAYRVVGETIRILRVLHGHNSGRTTTRRADNHPFAITRA